MEQKQIEIDFPKAYQYYIEEGKKRNFNVINFEQFVESFGQYCFLQEVIFKDYEFINKVKELIK